MHTLYDVAGYNDLVSSAYATAEYAGQLVLFLRFCTSLLCCCVVFAFQFSECMSEATRNMVVQRLAYSLTALSSFLVRFQSASPPFG